MENYHTDNRVVRIRVRNTGKRPVHIGSRFNFSEVTDSLEFDRDLAAGRHLNIPDACAVRFDPGAEMDVELIEFSDSMRRNVFFHNLGQSNAGCADFPAYYPPKLEAFRNCTGSHN